MQEPSKRTHDVPEPAEIPSISKHLSPFFLQAEPEPLEIDLRRTAIMVIDQQNSFIRKGGLFDLMGRDISKLPLIIDPIKRVVNAARTKGFKIIHISHINSGDLHDSGGPDGPYWYKPVIKAYREHPEWRDKSHFTSRWGAETIEELAPQEGDIVVTKPRYSAFFGTRLDMILKTYGIKYLVCLGGATNICVGTTIRDAFNLDYFCILVSDAVINNGPEITQAAEIFNIKSCFGWVTNSENIIKAIEAKEVG